uniref:Uncharacterized protein n=1 Tax=Chromera velia CCMP2878 TaxID=1169474 RepID=A0A0G4I8U6_9ALVE|eukprot:Cvel_11979.t1-p1 / transcript=Cvel_11979.t1 / gene=Cvel_11979 / organism=Chromera_velia_CCMP2878 / gene_product=hypothetical protein / transcript_product=hypothetical protein / location=Cvel_scaffold768:18657-25421(+) / protein_length=809 / sequence_SO=supercontig / SO=protein_coding / is_pseudo=false
MSADELRSVFNEVSEFCVKHKLSVDSVAEAIDVEALELQQAMRGKVTAGSSDERRRLLASRCERYLQLRKENANLSKRELKKRVVAALPSPSSRPATRREEKEREPQAPTPKRTISTDSAAPLQPESSKKDKENAASGVQRPNLSDSQTSGASDDANGQTKAKEEEEKQAAPETLDEFKEKVFKKLPKADKPRSAVLAPKPPKKVDSAPQLVPYNNAGPNMGMGPGMLTQFPPGLGPMGLGGSFVAPGFGAAGGAWFPWGMQQKGGMTVFARQQSFQHQPPMLAGKQLGPRGRLPTKQQQAAVRGMFGFQQPEFFPQQLLGQQQQQQDQGADKKTQEGQEGMVPMQSTDETDVQVAEREEARSRSLKDLTVDRTAFSAPPLLAFLTGSWSDPLQQQQEEDAKGRGQTEPLDPPPSFAFPVQVIVRTREKCGENESEQRDVVSSYEDSLLWNVHEGADGAVAYAEWFCRHHDLPSWCRDEPSEEAEGEASVPPKKRKQKDHRQQQALSMTPIPEAIVAQIETQTEAARNVDTIFWRLRQRVAAAAAAAGRAEREAEHENGVEKESEEEEEDSSRRMFQVLDLAPLFMVTFDIDVLCEPTVRFEDRVRWNLLNDDDEVHSVVRTSVEEEKLSPSAFLPIASAYKREILLAKRKCIADLDGRFSTFFMELDTGQRPSMPPKELEGDLSAEFLGRDPPDCVQTYADAARISAFRKKAKDRARFLSEIAPRVSARMAAAAAGGAAGAAAGGGGLFGGQQGLGDEGRGEGGPFAFLPEVEFRPAQEWDQWGPLVTTGEQALAGAVRRAKRRRPRN